MPRLASELIDLILSFLASDIDALRSCLDADPCIASIAFRHLHTKLRLRDDDLVSIDRGTGPHLSEIYKDLRRWPEIAEHVRDVTIDISWNCSGQHPDTLTFCRQASDILSGLDGLKRLDLRCSTSISWLTVRENFKAAFLDRIRKAPLKELSITGLFAFPISVFAECHTIQSLTLDGVFIVPRSSLSFDELESLSLRVPSSSLSRIITLVPLQNLRRLRFVAADPRDLRMLSRAFNGCPGLVDLDIDLSDHFVPGVESQIVDEIDDYIVSVTEIPCTLQTLSYLEHVTVRHIIASDYIFAKYRPDLQSCLPAIVRLLQTSPSLKRVTLNTLIHHDHIQDIDWSSLNRLFSSTGPQHLTHIHIVAHASRICRLGPVIRGSSISQLPALAFDPDLAVMMAQKKVSIETVEHVCPRNAGCCSDTQ